MSRIKFIQGRIEYEISVDSNYFKIYLEFKLELSLGIFVISGPVLPLNLPHYSLYLSLQQPASPVVFSLFQSVPLDPVNEPRHEKTSFLHMRKQRSRSASQ